MRVLLVEPYYGGSHRAWADGYRKSSEFDVTILDLPARWWKWRMRGGAVTLAEQAAELASTGYRPDVVLVSSMIDLGLLATLLDRVWGRVPFVMYMHESQLTYPDSPLMAPDASYGFTNWTSTLVADAVVFNSEYHRRVFFEEVRRLLRGFPDHRHEHLVDGVAAKSTVLPVGIDLEWVGPPVRDGGDPIIVWNHRWEHDKDPVRFFAGVRRLYESGLRFRLALCGESFRRQPTEFLEAARDFGDIIVHYGEATRKDYRRILARSDIVVSTARQEFFGMAVLEAIAAGAFPVLPDRLSYPAVIPDRFHDAVLYPDGGFVDALARAIENPDRLSLVPGLSEAARIYDWTRVAPRYDALVAEIAAGPGA